MAGKAAHGDEKEPEAWKSIGDDYGIALFQHKL
jgi:hypothetical protein